MLTDFPVWFRLRRGLWWSDAIGVVSPGQPRNRCARIQIGAQMNTVMHRVAAGGAALAAAALMAVIGAGPVAAAPNDQDISYITSNGQTNLAEIAIGELALQRAQNDSTRELAQMTLTDHQAALAKLQVVADELGVPLPGAPNPEQQANAALLSSVDTAAFDATYAQIQVAGHQKSIQGTNAEIAGGSDPAVVQYATGYLPVATHHLEMAQEVVAEVGGAPTAVPAGTAGLAASTPSSTVAAQLLLVVAGVGVLALGLTRLLRRRSVS